MARAVVRESVTVAGRAERARVARRARAEHEAWLREVEGIDLTLTFLRQKREETKRLARIAPVDLGIPVIAAPR
jgi:hypothetical protein